MQHYAAGYNYFLNITFFCLKIFFTFTNRGDPDEMQHYGSSLRKSTHLGVSRIQMVNEMSQCMRFPNNVVCATSKASDQPAHTCSLIRAFTSRLRIL